MLQWILCGKLVSLIRRGVLATACSPLRVVASKVREPVLAKGPLRESSETLPQRKEFGVFDIGTGAALGNLSRGQLKRLIGIHEKWGLETNDCFVMPETIQVISEEGGNAGITAFLEKALGGRDSMEIRWSVESTK